MDHELKMKWVAALRSGEYRQGTGTLHNSITDKHCCLGVLARVAGMEIGYDDLTGSSHIVVNGESAGMIPIQAILPVPTAVFYHMNDNERRSFDEIADYILTL